MRLVRRLALSCALPIFLLSAEARADILPPLTHLPHIAPKTIGLSFGVDGTYDVSVAFAYRFKRLFGKQFIPQVEGAYTQPLALIPGYDGGKISGTASMPFYMKNGLGVSVGLGPDVIFSKDAVGTRFGFGAEANIRPGHWGSVGVAALDLGYRIGYATCIVHKQAVSDLYGDRYPGGAPPGAASGATDGCIPAAAQRLRVGMILGGIGGQSGGGGIYIMGGYQHNFNAEGIFSSYPLTALPFYLQAGMSLIFK